MVYGGFDMVQLILIKIAMKIFTLSLK